MSPVTSETCPPWLDAALASYDADLVSLLAALERLASLARSGRDAATSDDVDALVRIGRDRGEVGAEMTAIGRRLEATRSRIAEHLALARLSAHFPAISSRHREGEYLVGAILEADRETLASLDHAKRHRRDVTLAIETGEATLAAYRRVVTPPPHSAGLVDQRG